MMTNTSPPPPPIFYFFTLFPAPRGLYFLLNSYFKYSKTWNYLIWPSPNLRLNLMFLHLCTATNKQTCFTMPPKWKDNTTPVGPQPKPKWSKPTFWTPTFATTDSDNTLANQPNSSNNQVVTLWTGASGHCGYQTQDFSTATPLSIPILLPILHPRQTIQWMLMNTFHLSIQVLNYRAISMLHQKLYQEKNKKIQPQ